MNKILPTNSVYQRVSLGGCEKEQLPLPYVHYPKHYGTFFTFSETIDGQPYLCECGESAILNYLDLRAIILEETTTRSSNFFELLDKQYLPPNLSPLMKLEKANILEQLNFKHAICHRCNLIPPNLRYCHEMYGGSFKQHFGWYINQTYLKFGILNNRYLSNITPQEFIDDLSTIELANIELWKVKEWYLIKDEHARQRIRDQVQPEIDTKEDFTVNAYHLGLLREATKKAKQATRHLSTKIENIVRGEFGFKNIGDQWDSETLLYQTLKSLFPNEQIYRHFRPPWLFKLELDVFFPSLKLGIEYQGQQHFYAIPAWGGSEALLQLQRRDLLKKEYCKAQEIELILFDFTEPITVDYVKSKIPAHYYQLTI